MCITFNVGYNVARPVEIPGLRCHQWLSVASFAQGALLTNTEAKGGRMVKERDFEAEKNKNKLKR